MSEGHATWALWGLAASAVPGAWAFLCWLLKLRPVGVGIATVVASLATVVGAIALTFAPPALPLSAPPWFHFDALSAWFSLVVALVGVTAALNALGYTKFLRLQPPEAEVGADAVAAVAQAPEPANPQRQEDPDRHESRFYMLFNFFLFSMFAVQLVDNLLLLCLLMELTTLISALLVCHERTRESVEAAWKYVSLCSVGIVFAFLGTLLLLYVNDDPGHATLDISALASGPPTATRPEFVKLAFLFALVGYGTKAGVAPLHTWIPDSHAQAPSPVSALLSGVLLKSAFYAILRFYSIVIHRLGPADARFASTVLLGFGLLSLLVAVPFIVRSGQRDPKRVLAYHSLEHMGILFFGAGLGTAAGLFAALLHAAYHALNKALVFFLHGRLRQLYRARGWNEQEHSILDVSAAYGVLFVIAGLALVGAPPFSLFTTEFLILKEAIVRVSEWSALGLLVPIVYLLSIVVIFGGLVNHLGTWIWGAERAKSTREDEQGLPVGVAQAASAAAAGDVPSTWFSAVPVAVLLVLILVCGFGVFPVVQEAVRAARQCVLP